MKLGWIWNSSGFLEYLVLTLQTKGFQPSPVLLTWNHGTKTALLPEALHTETGQPEVSFRENLP